MPVAMKPKLLAELMKLAKEILYVDPLFITSARAAP
jgi:hypothetical protein